MRFTATNLTTRGSRALVTAGVAASLLSVTACGYITPQQTSHQYVASDGINADLGPLKLRNVIVVAKDEKGTGRLIGSVFNSSSNAVTLTVNGADGSQTSIPVKANGTTGLTEKTDAAILSTAGGNPGSLVELKLSENASQQTSTIKVPVLDGTLTQYEQYLPTTATSDASTESATPTPTASSTGH
ncbi:hypothetical protein ACQR35_11290 [Pseudarthrobacter sp. J1738]|uniref:hypothetical protein n=1 Tax=unclassified Pseudarthrobacter TaxID=2647000 RepID=UPI003D2CDE8A